jgi:hypothetical protein
MSTFKNRRLYFQRIAQQSNLIADGVVVDGVPRKSFFRINGELELSAAVLEKANSPMMVNTGYAVMPSQPGMYVYFKTVVNELLFLSKFNAQNGIADEMENALDEAYNAASEFIQYLLKDFEENCCCGGLFHFDLNKSTLEMYGPVLDNLIGWRLTFNDTEKATEFKFNDGNFTEPNPTDIIYFYEVASVMIPWTEERECQFGSFPQFQVWFYTEDGPVIAWPDIKIDLPMPNATMFTINNGAVKSGYIVLK